MKTLDQSLPPKMGVSVSRPQKLPRFLKRHFSSLKIGLFLCPCKWHSAIHFLHLSLCLLFLFLFFLRFSFLFFQNFSPQFLPCVLTTIFQWSQFTTNGKRFFWRNEAMWRSFFFGKKGRRKNWRSFSLRPTGWPATSAFNRSQGALVSRFISQKLGVDIRASACHPNIWIDLCRIPTEDVSSVRHQ